MEVFDGQYYSITKWLLGLIGLWPYQTQSRRRLGFSMQLLFCFSSILPQSLFLIRNTNLGKYVYCVSLISIFYVSVGLFKYALIYFNDARLKLLLEQMVRNWQNLTKEATEVDIMSKHSKEGRTLVLFYVYYIFFAWLIYNMLPFTPIMLDIVFPLSNGTYDRIFPLYADYIFIDQSDYFYGSCIHAAIVYLVVSIDVLAVNGFFVVTVKHACGLFAVTCYRIENTGKTSSNAHNLYNIKPNFITHEAIVRTVELHNVSIRNAQLIEDIFSLCFLFVQSLVVIGIAFSFFLVLQISDETFNIIRIVIFIFGMIIFLLYLNWIGQKIIDSSNELFISAYFSDWYILSKEARRCMILVMARSVYPCQLTAGKVTVLSIETFGSLLKASLSYFTVLLSCL